MSTNAVAEPPDPGRRVLLLPPTPRDAEAVCGVLRDVGIPCIVCPSLEALCDEIHAGCGTVVVSEEALIANPDTLVACVRGQPVWSDLPTIVLSRAGIESPKLTAVVPCMGNIAVLERPVRITTFLSLVRSCLRGRERQYEVRAHLVECERAEINLRASEERLRLAVQTGKLGVWELDLVDYELTCSETCLASFGRGGRDRFTYEDFWKALHPDDLQRVRASVEATIAGTADYDIEYRINWPDGSTHWLLVRGQLTRLPDGTPTRLVGVTLDITERKNAEEQRAVLLEAERAARSEAERAGKMKDEFLATLSHELRTPLNAILGWSQILAADPRDDPTLVEGLHTIERNARAQTQIIEDLLDMSRIVSGKVRLDVRPIGLSDVLRAAVETVRPAADARRVRLEVSLNPSADQISGDPNRLQQVFWNLLSNAVKFTPPEKFVRVVLKRKTTAMEVSVIDTGEGIKPDFLPHVFDRFRQADASMSRRHGGLGLGLAIVKQLVELHGGTVTAKSAGADKGSTFTVSLPLKMIQPTTERAMDRAQPKVIDGSATAADNIAGARILIVEDEPDSRALMKRVLENCNAIVTAASSAAEGVRALESERPDILISDIGMPGEDGYSFIRRVRSLPRDKGGQTPAVALTAYARSEDRANAVNAGFQHHITKPVESVELIALIAGILRKSE